MKFAHEFKEALIKEGFPAHWVETAIPYGQLKKCIKRVEKELRSIGLDSATLAQLVPQQNELLEIPHRSVAFEYNFEGQKDFRPRLTLFVHLQDGQAVDAALTPQTRAYLEQLALRQGHRASKSAQSSHCSLDDSQEIEQEVVQAPIAELDSLHSSIRHTPATRRIEVPLTFDNEFFGVIQNDVSALDTLQESEQKSLSDEILALSEDMKTITKPSKYSKSDLYRWRELFEIYLEASPFFSIRESDSGSRSCAMATKQLQWFQSEVTKRNLVRNFKLSASRKALDRFIAINVSLLQNLSFQEINQTAITKILKSKCITTSFWLDHSAFYDDVDLTYVEFDKRTKLGATKTFPWLIRSESIMTKSMAKAVCAQMSTDLVSVVPQLDDHLCPVCFTIYWKPIRMKCRHVFCIRCTVLMQRQKKRLCPLCREDVIMLADTDNIDADLIKYLQKYFPKETKEKQIAIETADGIEQYGLYYKHPTEYECVIM